MMDQQRLSSLLHQYFELTISKDDRAELLDYFKSTDLAAYDDLLDHYLKDLSSEPDLSPQQAQNVLARIKSDPQFISVQGRVTAVPLYRQTWFRVAATLLICCSIGFYMLKGKLFKQSVQNDGISAKLGPIRPGGNKATLKLANGTMVELNDAKKGLIAKAGKISVNNTGHGQIAYHNDGTAENIAYNVFSTPKGGDYQITLADGTTVRLNSASELSFPLAFNGNERNVKLNGEAYFEVAKNKDKPFYVMVNDVKVRVLGTHFNIKAYSDDESITTTLLEGAVKMTKHGSESLLVPGQKGVAQPHSDAITVSAANLAQVSAWRKGYFKFEDENITTIMKEISRWYDVDVEYQGNFTGQVFGGTFYRSKSITELLTYLEKLGKVHFKIAGRRVIVMN